jgi:hypothetical protein
LLNDTAPRALVRIAIPSFKIGWRKSKSATKKPVGPTVEEFQSLFQDDFRRTAKAKIVMTDEERQDYNQAVDLRSALYGPKSH